MYLQVSLQVRNIVQDSGTAVLQSQGGLVFREGPGNHGAESIGHTEWSLSGCLKAPDIWLYMITSKLSQNTVNVLSKAIGLASVRCYQCFWTMYNLMLSHTNCNIEDQRQ